MAPTRTEQAAILSGSAHFDTLLSLTCPIVEGTEWSVGLKIQACSLEMVKQTWNNPALFAPS
jgi:hypothetical protein